MGFLFALYIFESSQRGRLCIHGTIQLATKCKSSNSSLKIYQMLRRWDTYGNLRSLLLDLSSSPPSSLKSFHHLVQCQFLQCRTMIFNAPLLAYTVFPLCSELSTFSVVLLFDFLQSHKSNCTSYLSASVTCFRTGLHLYIMYSLQGKYIL